MSLRSICKSVVLPVTCLALTILCSPGHAQTMGFAEAGAKLAAACGKDIDKFCKGVNLGNGQLGACLIKNRDAVSAGCNQTAGEILDGIDRRAKARTVVLKICDADIRRLCGGVAAGDGQVLECMLTASRGVSKKCNQAIADAGYR